MFYGDGPWNREPTPMALGKEMSRVIRDWSFGDVDRDGDVDSMPYQINRGDGLMTSYAQALANRNGQKPTGRVALVAFRDVLGITEQHDPDFAFLKVQRETEEVAREFSPSSTKWFG